MHSMRKHAKHDFAKLTTHHIYKIDHKRGHFPGKSSSAYKTDKKKSLSGKLKQQGICRSTKVAVLLVAYFLTNPKSPYYDKRNKHWCQVSATNKLLQLL